MTSQEKSNLPEAKSPCPTQFYTSALNKNSAQSTSPGIFPLSGTPYFCLSNNASSSSSLPSSSNLATLSSTCSLPPSSARSALTLATVSDPHYVVFGAHIVGPEDPPDSKVPQCEHRSSGEVLLVKKSDTKSDKDFVYSFNFFSDHSFSPQKVHNEGEGWSSIKFTMRVTCAECDQAAFVGGDADLRRYLFSAEGRLVGPSISHCTQSFVYSSFYPPQRQQEHSVIDVEFDCKGRDGGDHLLEVKVSRLPVAATSTDRRALPVNHLALRKLVTMPHSALRDPDVGTACGDKDYRHGRWIRKDDFEKAPVDWENDEMGYNVGYTYKPYSCDIKRYSEDELGKCFAGKNIMLSGDSLGREVFMGLFQVLMGDKLKETTADTNGKSYKSDSTGVSLAVPFTGRNDPLNLRWAGGDFYFRHTPELGWEKDTDVFIVSPETIMQIFSGKGFAVPSVNAQVARQTVLLDWLTNPDNVPVKEGIKLIWHGNPAAHHASGSALPSNIDQFNRLGFRVVSDVVEAVNEFTDAKNITTIPGLEITKSRWDASHDGVHYMFGLNRDEVEDDVRNTLKGAYLADWHGGVSSAQVYVLIDILCRDVV